MIEIIVGFVLCSVLFLIASYLFRVKSDELEYLRIMLNDEIEHRKMRENELLTYLRVRPSIQNGATYIAQSATQPISRGGIREFRQRQHEAESARVRKIHDESLRRKNPDYNPEQLASDIAELDDELGTNG